MLPNARKKTRGHVGCLKTLNQWLETSRASSLHFFFLFYFQPVNNQSPIFTQTLKSKLKFTFFEPHCKSFLRRKPIHVFNHRQLYCSSLTTAVGFRMQILLISAPLLWHESGLPCDVRAELDGPHLGLPGRRYITKRPEGGIQTQSKVGKIHRSSRDPL